MTASTCGQPCPAGLRAAGHPCQEAAGHPAALPHRVDLPDGTGSTWLDGYDPADPFREHPRVDTAPAATRPASRFERLAARVLGPKRVLALTLGIELVCAAVLGSEDEIESIVLELLNPGEGRPPCA